MSSKDQDEAAVAGCFFAVVFGLIALLVVPCVAGAFIDGMFGTSIIENLREAFKPLHS